MVAVKVDCDSTQVNDIKSKAASMERIMKSLALADGRQTVQLNGSI